MRTDLDDSERLRMILELNTVLCQHMERGLSSVRYGGEDSLKKAIDRLADGIGLPAAAPTAPPF